MIAAAFSAAIFSRTLRYAAAMITLLRRLRRFDAAALCRAAQIMLMMFLSRLISFFADTMLFFSIFASAAFISLLSPGTCHALFSLMLMVAAAAFFAALMPLLPLIAFSRRLPRRWRLPLLPLSLRFRCYASAFYDADATLCYATFHTIYAVAAGICQILSILR